MITPRIVLAALLLVTPVTLVTRNKAESAAVPTVARFHLALSKAEPAKNDTVAASPKEIKLWFTESVQAAATGVRVIGTANHQVALGKISVAAAEKSPAVAVFKEVLKPGKYTVNWKTMAADGHPSSGTFMFVVGAKAAQ